MKAMLWEKKDLPTRPLQKIQAIQPVQQRQKQRQASTSTSASACTATRTFSKRRITNTTASANANTSANSSESNRGINSFLNVSGNSLVHANANANANPNPNAHVNVIPPLHRSLWYLILAFLLQSIAYLQRTHLERYLPTSNWSGVRPTQLRQSQRPVLYLHVGPKKTASTTIQLDLLQNQNIVDALRKDNITVGSMQFNYLKVQKLRDECLTRPQHCRRRILDKFLRDMMVDYPEDMTGKVIKSCETYSNLPRNQFTEIVFRALLQKWRVKVIIVYRRPSAWLPSLYSQQRKGNMYFSRDGKWQDWDNAIGKNHNQVVAISQFFNQTANFIGDSLSTYEYFVQVYGEKNVLVVDMETTAGVAHDLFCRVLNTTHACEALQSHQVTVHNDNAQFLFDEDLIAVEAYRQGLLGVSSPVNHRVSAWVNTTEHDVKGPGEQRNHSFTVREPVVSRHTATVRLRNLLQQHSITAQDLPQTCLTEKQEEMLWNRTRKAEDKLARNPRSDTELRQVFSQDKSRFCTVDASAILQNSTWRHLLFGDKCHFIHRNVLEQEGCDMNWK